MALAEARLIWQRTANRCFVQEDAKRAPKLTRCSSSLPPSVKQADIGYTGLSNPKEYPQLHPSHLNECPRSKWWMETSPSCGYPKVPMNDQFNPMENNMEISQEPEYSEDVARNGGDDHGLLNDGKGHELEVECLTLCGENTPWWRTADADELALLVAKRSLDCIENCDLPHPQKPHLNKDPGISMYCFGEGRISSSRAGYNPEGSKFVVAGEGQLKAKPFRDGDVPEHERKAEMPTDPTKAKLLEALCHSQTRAREAEGAAKRACTEKDDIINMVLKQAGELFAYKQWLGLLELENMCLQLINEKSEILPAVTRSRKEARREVKAKAEAKQCKGSQPVGKCVAVIAVGLGLVGTGFLLGWTVAQMLPTW